MKVASVREVVLGAPLRVILKHLASRGLAPGMDQIVALVHRPNESFFVFPQVSCVLVFSIKVRFRAKFSSFMYSFYKSICATQIRYFLMAD